MRRLFAAFAAMALAIMPVASPASAASISVKSGQTIDGAVSAPVVQPTPKKLCWDGSTIDLAADCPLVTAPATEPTVINASTSTNGVFLFPVGTTTNAAIRNFAVNHAYRAIEAPTGALVDGVTIENITATDLQRAFARFHGNRNLTLRHITATMRAAPQTSSSNFPVCITSQGEHQLGGLLLDDVHCSGFYMKLADQTKYGNGDGADLDDQNPECNVTILNSVFDHNSDGGVDIKCPRNHFDNVLAFLNARNFRFWYGTDSGTISCGDAVRLYGTGGVACVWVESTVKYNTVIHIRKLIVNQTKPTTIIVIDGSAKIVIDACELHVPTGTKFVSGKLLAGSSFGPGCSVS